MRSKNNKFCNRSYLITKMVRLVDKLWNQLELDLRELQQNLELEGIVI